MRPLHRSLILVGALAWCAAGGASARAEDAPTSEPLVLRRLRVTFSPRQLEPLQIDGMESDPFTVGAFAAERVRYTPPPAPFDRWRALLAGDLLPVRRPGLPWGFAPPGERGVSCTWRVQGTLSAVRSDVALFRPLVLVSADGITRTTRTYDSAARRLGRLIALGAEQTPWTGRLPDPYWTARYVVVLRRSAAAALGPAEHLASWRLLAQRALERRLAGAPSSLAAPLELAGLVPVAGAQAALRGLLNAPPAEGDHAAAFARRVRRALLLLDDPLGLEGDWSFARSDGAAAVRYQELDPERLAAGRGGAGAGDATAGFAHGLARTTRSPEIFAAALQVLGPERAARSPRLQARLGRAAELGLPRPPGFATSPPAGDDRGRRPLAGWALAGWYLVSLLPLGWLLTGARPADLTSSARTARRGLTVGGLLLALDPAAAGIDLLPDLAGYAYAAAGLLALRRASLDRAPLLPGWGLPAFALGAAGALVVEHVPSAAADLRLPATLALLVGGIALCLALRRFFAAAGRVASAHLALVLAAVFAAAFAGWLLNSPGYGVVQDLPAAYRASYEAALVCGPAAPPLLLAFLLIRLRPDAVTRHRAQEARLARPQALASTDRGS